MISRTANRDYLTIVSGLPRSGTSMMMKMLEAGGLSVVVDHIRTPDDDNPNGYYEFEAVKKTKDDASWLKGAIGKAVKMVYRLLYDLPPEYEYRVVFMRRHLDEVLASQAVMLERHGQSVPSVEDAKMKELFLSQLAKVEKWLASQPNFAVLEVDYNLMHAEPETQIAALDEFLGGGLNREAMRGVLNPALYRNRHAATPS